MPARRIRLPTLRDVFGNIRLVHGLGQFNFGLKLGNMNVSPVNRTRPKGVGAARPEPKAKGGHPTDDPNVARQVQIESLRGLTGGRTLPPRMRLENYKPIDMTEAEKQRIQWEAGRRVHGGGGQRSSPTTTVETGRGTTPGAVPRGDTLRENIYLEGTRAANERKGKPRR